MYARVVLGAAKSVPFREVSSIQGCPYRGVPLYMYKFIPQLVCSCHCHTLICSIAWERQCSVHIHIDLPYLCIIRASAYALILLITFRN